MKIHEQKLSEGTDFENFDDIAANMFGDAFGAGGKAKSGKKSGNGMFDMGNLMFEMMGSMGGMDFDPFGGAGAGAKKKKSKKK